MDSETATKISSDGNTIDHKTASNSSSEEHTTNDKTSSKSSSQEHTKDTEISTKVSSEAQTIDTETAFKSSSKEHTIDTEIAKVSSEEHTRDHESATESSSEEHTIDHVTATKSYLKEGEATQMEHSAQESSELLSNQSEDEAKPELISPEKQQTNAFLRERFLRAMAGIVGKECKIHMLGNLDVTATFRSCSVKDMSTMYVSDLKTPSGVVSHALIRMSDVLSMQIDDIDDVALDPPQM
ncbi:unnamed protein product [Timema podura]|uniref:Uncharacterized protein n=1 Tax=Timema podura TaxID=61482 RepID=A0ABN7P7J4_TIMPD|nr:unnamed protein product [Timema podura]